MGDDVSVEESPVGPVIRPAEDTELVILYLHGNQDGPEPALDLARRLALLTGATVVCPRYRSAFPAALIDAHSGYSYCQAAGPVVVLGEGIGAALATAMLVQLRDSEATSPRCAVLLSALLDLTLETKSLLFNASTDPAFDIIALRQRVTAYARNTPLTDSRLSPLYANLHGLPPIQLLAAGTDPLLDDSLAFATRAARSRVTVDLQVWPENTSFRAEAVQAMADFIRAKHPAMRAGAPA
ncbi:alpha/beta hydrolase [Prauserella endophytica]|uniref:alpha/beta hydrolase n=1 Tax=Prauserella endophytica TaxID=1592324 RepID=UPI00197DCB0E|nr:alpha/beta hydrolase [Prauserella endophytica]